MSSLVPGPIKARVVLNGNVGGIRCEGNRILPQDEGLLMMDPILASDVQITPFPPGRLVFDILVEIKSLVGEELGMCKGHGRFERQVGREVGDVGKSD